MPLRSLVLVAAVVMTVVPAVSERSGATAVDVHPQTGVVARLPSPAPKKRARKPSPRPSLRPLRASAHTSQ